MGNYKAEVVVATTEYGINAQLYLVQRLFNIRIRITDITDEGRFSSDDNIASVAIDNYHKFLLTDGDIVSLVPVLVFRSIIVIDPVMRRLYLQDFDSGSSG